MRLRPLLESSCRVACQEVKLLRCVELLCTSTYVADYVRTWAPRGQVAHTCYAADYGLFDGAALPRLEPWKTRAARVEEGRDARATAKPPRALQERDHMYATVVSPCKAKGIELLVEIATLMPRVPFLAVCTKWTKEADKATLSSLKNVRLLPGAPSEKMDAEVWKRTRVLVAPSLWPEPFGLVAIEASLRGLPAVSTDLAGLPEANVVPEHVVETNLVHDVEIDATFVPPQGGAGTRLAAFERQRPRLVADLYGDARPPRAVDSVEATSDDLKRVARRFAAILDPLMAPDGTMALKAASKRAYERAHAHLDSRRHAMAALFRSDLDAPAG